MASRIAGITIEIGGDTKGLQKSLKGVDSQLKTTQSNLKDIDKLLKANPGSVELLTQKQKNLESAIGLTKQRLNELKNAQSQVEKGSKEWDALQREIIATETDLKSLEKQYRQFGSVAGQAIKAAGKSMENVGGKISEFGQKLAPISGAATAVGGALLKLGYDAVKNADELNTLAKQTGFTTDQIQKMQYASDLVDVSFEDIAGALKKFKGKIDPANESLKKLGVSVTNANGELRNAPDVFMDAVKALSQIKNETERDQAAMDLFGKSADNLAGIIDDGGAALEAYGQQAEDLGLILDGDTLSALNDTNDQIDQMKAQIQGTMGVIGAKVVPIVAPLLEKVASLIGTVSEKLQSLTPEQTELIMKIVGIVAAVAPLLIVGGKLISSIGTIVSVVGTVVGILGGPLTIAIAAVVAAGILLWKNWDTIKATALAFKDQVVEAWNNIQAGISAAIANISAKFQSFKAKFDELKSKVQNVWNSIKSILTSKITLPHIPLPHFSISPAGWQIGDLLKGKIPTLSIKWYRAAYDNPILFTQPTVVGTPYGLKGFGDGHGAEIVMGLDKLRELVGGMQSGMTVQVVLEGDARSMLRVINKANVVQTRATNFNMLAAGV